MFRLSRLVVLPVVATGLLMVAGASEAQAQVRVQIGGFGLNVGGHHGRAVYRGGHHFVPNVYGNSVCPPNYGLNVYGHHGLYRGGVHSYRHGYYHGTTHFDYHPPEVYRHGNHYDFQPGHYDLHRSGHYHH